jgi:uncharacterized protein YkwD
MVGRYKFHKQMLTRRAEQGLSHDEFESRELLIRIKRALFDRINTDRRAHGLNRVAYDRLAAQAGESHCREMLANRYVSHWNLEGLKPYHRFASAGGTDAVSENCAGADVTQDFYHSVDDVIEGVLESHAVMLAEVPPNDGHRRTILDPNHTHVGIGLAFNRRGMRMTQEFVGRYVALDPLPAAARRGGSEFTVSGRTLNPQHRVACIAVHFEPPPRPHTPQELQHTGSYGLPDVVDYKYPVCPPGMRYQDGSTGSIVSGRDGIFRCPIKFNRGRPGFYTLRVWLMGGAGQSIPATNLTLYVV